jgi:hypothetical protein
MLYLVFVQGLLPAIFDFYKDVLVGTSLFPSGSHTGFIASGMLHLVRASLM